MEPGIQILGLPLGLASRRLTLFLQPPGLTTTPSHVIFPVLESAPSPSPPLRTMEPLTREQKLLSAALRALRSDNRIEGNSLGCTLVRGTTRAPIFSGISLKHLALAARLGTPLEETKRAVQLCGNRNCIQPAHLAERRDSKSLRAASLTPPSERNSPPNRGSKVKRDHRAAKAILAVALNAFRKREALTREGDCLLITSTQFSPTFKGFKLRHLQWAAIRGEGYDSSTRIGVSCGKENCIEPSHLKISPRGRAKAPQRLDRES